MAMMQLASVTQVWTATFRFRLGGDPPTLTNIRVKKELGEGNLADDDLIYVRLTRPTPLCRAAP